MPRRIMMSYTPPSRRSSLRKSRPRQLKTARVHDTASRLCVIRFDDRDFPQTVPSASFKSSTTPASPVPPGYEGKTRRKRQSSPPSSTDPGRFDLRAVVKAFEFQIPDRRCTDRWTAVSETSHGLGRSGFTIVFIYCLSFCL